MPVVRKVPYYQMESRLLYSGKHWKSYSGVVGCVPIDTQQKISFDRLAPNEPPPPKAAAPVAPHTPPPAAPASAKPPAKPPPSDKHQDAERADKLPEFDLQDIPKAMDKMGWPISAKLAREWLASPKHVYNNDLNSVQPLDDTTVTLDWALKFRGASARLNQLVRQAIYTPNALRAASKVLAPVIEKIFSAGRVNAAGVSIDTSPFVKDPLQFHIGWGFQYQPVWYRDDRSDRCLGELQLLRGHREGDRYRGALLQVRRRAQDLLSRTGRANYTRLCLHQRQLLVQRRFRLTDAPVSFGNFWRRMSTGQFITRRTATGGRRIIVAATS